MRTLIESTFVSLGGDIGAPQEWGLPYLFGPEPEEYSRELLFGAGALLLGRKTYEGLSAGYTAMAAEPGPTSDFVATMNAIPKYVASTTLADVGWNATLLGADVAAAVAELKEQPGKYLLKYGTGRSTGSCCAAGSSTSCGSGSCPSRPAPGSDSSRTSMTSASR